MEFIGTFALGSALTLCVSGSYFTAGPLILGANLMVLTFVGGHISGAHYNPAVSLATFVNEALHRTGEFPWWKLIMYWSTQFAAGFAAALMGISQNGNAYFAPSDVIAEDHDADAWKDYWDGVVVGADGNTTTGNEFSISQTRDFLRTTRLPDLYIFLLEAVFSAMYVLSFLNSQAASGSAKKNSHFGMTIGFSYLATIVAIGKATGACINPAMAFLGYLTGDTFNVHSWIHCVAPLVGALLAVGIFKIIDLPFEFCHKMQDDMNDNVDMGYAVRERGRNIFQKAFNEFLGTFFLCFYIVCAVIYAGGRPYGTVSLGVGAMLMVQVYRGGYISGGHYNPAVTIAVFVENMLRRSADGANKCFFYVYAMLAPLVYVGCQVGAGVAAGTFGLFLFGNGMGFPRPEGDAADPVVWTDALMWESTFTFLLCLTVLTVALGSVRGNQYYGLAIGFIVYVGAEVVGDKTGGCFNPAIAVLANMAAKPQQMLYLFVPISAAVAAGFFFLITEPSDHEAIEDATREAKASASVMDEDGEEGDDDDEGDSAEDLKEQVRRFFEAVNPAKLEDPDFLDNTMERYAGREQVLLQILERKYSKTSGASNIARILSK